MQAAEEVDHLENFYGKCHPMKTDEAAHASERLCKCVAQVGALAILKYQSGGISAINFVGFVLICD